MSSDRTRVRINTRRRPLQSFLESDTSADDEDDDCIPKTETVTSKCIGAVHDPNAQDTLQKVRDLLREGKDVRVKIIPEPENRYDSKAIAFQCYIESKWIRIGYIVQEALDDVHQALSTGSIISVSFSWVKYLITWPSAPGYFAGIDITVSGKW